MKFVMRESHFLSYNYWFELTEHAGRNISSYSLGNVISNYFLPIFHRWAVIWLQSKLCDWSHSHKRDFDCSQALFRPLTMTWLRTSIQQSWLWLFLTTSALQEVNTLTAIAVMTFLPFLAPVGRFFPFRPASYPKSREILHFSAWNC